MKKIEELSEEELDKLVTDYINAEDIIDFDTDYLENNYAFMARVMMKSNDKKLYDFCSNELKENLGFVKFLVTKFKTDTTYVDKVLMEYFSRCGEEEKLKYETITFFINNLSDKSKLRIITDYFINNSNDEVKKLELMLILSNDHDNFLEYSINANTEIVENMAEIQAAIKSLEDPKQKNLAGLGFGIIKEKYQSSEIITNDIAARCLYEIFYRNDFNIEKFLHQSFSSKNAVEQYGLNAFIGDYIKRIDRFLAEYVLARPELLKPILKDFNYAFSRWDDFIEKNNDDRISIIYEEAEKYLENNDDGIAFSYSEAVHYIAKKKGLDKIFDEYNIKKFYKGFEEFYEPTSMDNIYEYSRNFNLTELKYLKFVEDLFDKLFYERVVEEVSDDYIIEEAKPGQIFDFVSSTSRK